MTDTSTPIPAPANGTELIERFLPESPFVAVLGIEAVELADDRAALRLPYDPANTTYGNIVHGGAIAALVDVAVMATAWAGAPLPEQLRGVTVSLSTEFLDVARAEDLFAHGRVIRRGRTLCRAEIGVETGDGRLIAKALGTYKVG